MKMRPLEEGGGANVRAKVTFEEEEEGWIILWTDEESQEGFNHCYSLPPLAGEFMS